MYFKKTFLYSVIRYMYKNHISLKIFKQKLNFKSTLDPKYYKIVKELKANGCVKIEKFFSEKDILKFRESIVDKLNDLDKKHCIETENDVIMYEKNSKMIKKEFGYSRLFEVVKFNPNLESFIHNRTIKDIVSAYYGRECYPYQSTAQKSLPINNVGLEWHIDDFYPRFKALIYLYDVAVDDGPFAVLKKTHKIFWKKLIKIHRMHTRDYRKDSIFSKEEIKKFENEKEICTGKAGDLFLADVCAIHRGTELKKDHQRYAIFNFYSPDRIK